jgi:two-component system, NtrC family, sensor histidine kinase HydH
VSEVRRVNNIIQQFLKFARPPKLDTKPSDINSLLDETIKLISAQTKERGIIIESHFSILPEMMLDPNQMKQAFLNIFQNGIEAIEGPGKIRVTSTITQNNEVLIEISDSGIGISQDTLSKIFNLYFSTKSSGTGLGLSLVHQIISQHSGRIEVSSEPGKGTSFLIYLPVLLSKSIIN